MKRHHFLLFALLLIVLVGLIYFIKPPKTIAPENNQLATSTNTISALHYENKSIAETNTASYYTLKAHYPVFVLTDPAITKKINNSVTGFINEEFISYRSTYGGTGGNTRTNGGVYGTSTVQIDSMVIKNIRLANILPIRFDEEFYSAGAAHPGVNIVTFNYDLKTGEKISLAELFKSGSPYLEAISKASIKILKEKLGRGSSIETINTGAAAKEENFKVFLITDAGLKIIFTEYQVASYAAGEQEVTIPWKELQSILNPTLNLL